MRWAAIKPLESRMVLLLKTLPFVPTTKRPPIMTQNTPFLPGLSPVQGKPLTATFDAGLMSSDGGMIVLSQIASRLGLADALYRR